MADSAIRVIQSPNFVRVAFRDCLDSVYCSDDDGGGIPLTRLETLESLFK